MQKSAAVSSSHPNRELLKAGASGDAEGIRRELTRVLSSAQFRSSERSRQFLEFVVEQTLSGDPDRIKAYTIAIDCFGREPNFDPQIDPYVRIVARRMRRALRHYYEEEGAESEIRIDVPKGSYVPLFLSNNIVAGNSALKAPPEVPSDDSPPTAAPIDRASTIAVVRLDSHGADSDFLASGLTQEIILALSRFSEVLIVGPVSIPAHDARDSSPRDIGRDHNAEFVLMGTVHRLGDRLRISMSLSDVASSAMLWGHRFESDLTVQDLFEVQDEIARQVAATVGDAAGVIVRQVAERTRGRHPKSLSSYEAVLQGWHWNMALTPESLEEAHEALVHAVETDPGYSLAKALLSDIYFSDWCAGIDGIPDALDQAEELAAAAVALDPFSSDAHWALGQVHHGRKNPGRFRAEFDAALQLNPSRALYRASFGLFLMGLEEWDEAIDSMETATELNPQQPAWYLLVSIMNHARLGEWEAALGCAKCFSAPGLIWRPALLAMALGHLDRVDEAAPHIESLLEIKADFRTGGRELLSRLLCADANVALVAEGLKKAGLELE